MPARSIGTATISFGLVSIPIKLYSTVDTGAAVRFNYLSKDGSRLRQQYIRASDGEVVERQDRIQGYEFAKGQYVTFSEEEIKALHVESTNGIDIAEFIPLAQVERLYIEKVYYLGPDKGAARSYHLLKAALSKTGRAALASYAARGRSHLVLVRPMGEGLVMEQLKYQEELRPFDEVPLDTVEVADAELDLAVQIVEQRASADFQPEKYENTVRAHMLRLIEQKVQGEEVSVAPEERSEAKIIDLMEALRATVGDAGEDGASRKPARRATPKVRRPRAKADAGKGGAQDAAETAAAPVPAPKRRAGAKG